MGLSAFELEAVIKFGANVVLEDGREHIDILEKLLNIAVEMNTNITIYSTHYSSLELERIAKVGGKNVTIISR